MYTPHFIYSSISEHLDRFHVLPIVNNTVNMRVQILVQVPAFDYFEYVPRSKIDGSYISGNV